MVLAAVLILGALSFTNTSYSLFGYESKKIDLLKDIRYTSQKHQPPFPDILFTDVLRDSINKVKQQQQRIAIQSFSKNDTVNAMDRFFRALYQTKQTGRKTRIAYFGDSMIEGDLLTQDLRASLQKLFGGSGVGFVPVTSIVAGFRQTIIHSFSSDWQVYNFNQPGGETHAIAPSGYTFVPNTGSWVSYTSPKAFRAFNQVKLYYGKSNGNNKIDVTLPGGSKQFSLQGDNSVNELTVNPSDYISSIRVNFKPSNPVNIYGFSFETPFGVLLDNYAFRGNSGLPLTSVPRELYQGFDNYFNYDLIVLQYGLNVVKHNTKDYSWYERGLENIIDNMKQNFPNTSLLIVSLGDKSYQETEAEGYHTEPDVPVIVAMQRKVAEKTGVAFWNLYENMGGYDAMKHWVEGDTVYANHDYAHPNAKGAKRISDMLFNKLMEGYNHYVSKQTE